MIISPVDILTISIYLVANIWVRLWLIIRKTKIKTFHFHCLNTIHEALPLMPDFFKMCNDECFTKQYFKYDKIKPNHDDMLYSFKKLTIENWFTENQIKTLFGLPHQSLNKQL
ncbi:MAG: hypothetical protein COA50_01210 [Flavobacteriaceae bacterium]|nr:MAG: hypothetical protein COA50_01210 [Flavobacteriaceae bacterium]